MKDKKVSKKASHILDDLDTLVDHLDYFGGNSEYFRKEVLPRVRNIEEFIKTRAVNQSKTFREIASRYEKVYEQKAKNLEDSKLPK